MIRKNIHLSEQQIKSLEKLAKSSGLPVAELVRRAVDEYLARQNMRRAFTLIELLVSMAVISLLMGLLLPALQAARAATRVASCQSNLHQIGISIHDYEAIHGRLPLIYAEHADDLVVFCPLELLKPWTDRTMYQQTYPDMYPTTRLQLVEEQRAPSDRIPIVMDWQPHENGLANVLYLDGHVE